MPLMNLDGHRAFLPLDNTNHSPTGDATPDANLANPLRTRSICVYTKYSRKLNFSSDRVHFILPLQVPPRFHGGGKLSGGGEREGKGPEEEGRLRHFITFSTECKGGLEYN